MFSNEAYNFHRTHKIPVLPNAAYAVYDATQCSTSTKRQVIKQKMSLSDINNKEGGTVANTQAKAEPACTKIPVHLNKAYAIPQRYPGYAKVPDYPYTVPHRECQVSSYAKVPVYPNEAYTIVHRKNEVGREAPGPSKVDFASSEGYGAVAPHSRVMKRKEVKKQKGICGNKGKSTTGPFAPRKTKAGKMSGCGKVAVFPNKAYAVCVLSPVARGKEKKSVCDNNGKVTGSVVPTRANAIAKVPRVAVFPNLVCEQVGQEQDEAVYEKVI